MDEMRLRENEGFEKEDDGSGDGWSEVFLECEMTDGERTYDEMF